MEFTKEEKRIHRMQAQSVKGLVVTAAYDGHAMAVVSSYADALEYGRMYLRDEAAVFVNTWGYVMETETVEWASHPPVAIAPSKAIVEMEKGRQWVDVYKLEMRIYSVRVVTFKETEPPMCGKLRRVEAGSYLTGVEGDPERFKVFKAEGRKVLWGVRDTKTEREYTCFASREQAIRRINRILEVEHTSARIGEGFKDYNMH